MSVDENSSQSEVRIYASDSTELDSISSSLESMGDADPIAYDGAALAHARGRDRAAGTAGRDARRAATCRRVGHRGRRGWAGGRWDFAPRGVRSSP